MHQYKGKLIVHTGSMFSGKTSSLKNDLNRFKIAGYRVSAFKPVVDTRGGEKITIHDAKSMDAKPLKNIFELIDEVKRNNLQVVGIDEVQFLKDDISDILECFEELLKSGITIVVAGLDMDYNAHAFEVVKELMPYADYLYKHHAVCTRCGADAWVSHRKVKEQRRVFIGAEDEYEPLCRNCYREITEEEERKVNKNQISFETKVN